MASEIPGLAWNATGNTRGQMNNSFGHERAAALHLKAAKLLKKSDPAESEKHMRQYTEHAARSKDNGIEPIEDRHASAIDALWQNATKDVDFYWDAANQKAVPIRGSGGYKRSKAGDPAKKRRRK